MSPKHGKELLETVHGIPGVPAPSPDGQSLAEARRERIEQADPIGTMPAPGTAEGVLKSGAKMLAGEKPQILVDKLAERAAFERGGARLYDALLTKFQGEARSGRNGGTLGDVSEAKLREIREQEADHFRLLAECIETLGADPTAETPSADLAGVESMGLLQVVSDARTSFLQSLHAVLAAELIDHASWELLCEMAEKAGQRDMAEKLRGALRQEEDHLRHVRGWYASLTMAESGA
jgi:rubrerythrin